MKKYMPLEGLRWSRDSGSALYDTPQNGRSRTGWGVLMVFELLFLSYGKRLVRTNLSCTFQYEWLPSVAVFPF